LEAVARERNATQVVLAELPRDPAVLNGYIEVCERLGIRLLVASDLEERFHHSIILFEDDGMRFVGLRDEPLQDHLNCMLKRGMDLAISVPVVLFVLPPVTILVWILQRWQSPGPIFFVQPRTGMQNRVFKIIKFRSMYFQREEEQGRQATRGDRRVFRAGAWLRKFSIDELPQFFNVITGEMSVVGPRPHLRQHNQMFERTLSNYHVRANVKPGITGLAQVRGYRGEIREEKDIVNRVRADIEYLERWSFAMDCYIILLTFKHMLLPPQTAY
jgi:lipopolysaccharide/colanic/teichoic acid biosynthesis glycosyltransferase